MFYHIFKTLFLFFIAFSWTSFIELLVKYNKLSIELSRKSIHIGIGVLYIICWSIYNPSCFYCRYYASLVPLIVVIKFICIVLGLIQDKLTVKMLCRDGINHPEQLLYGPLMYGIVIILATIYYWLDSIEGLIIITILCVGDGIAAVIGKSYPLISLPWNKNKSLGGSLSFILFSYIFLLLSLYWFSYLGFPVLNNISNYWEIKILFICILSSFIESFNIGVYDNIIVPLFALILTKLIF